MLSFVRSQPDYYVTLEIDPSADAAAIKAAFHRLAWRYHPDRNPAPEATLQFQNINEARRVLSDPVFRAKYDSEWHPEIGIFRRHSHVPRRSHSHRRSRSRHSFRRAILSALAFVLIISTWATTFVAMSWAHSETAMAVADDTVGFVAATSEGYAVPASASSITYNAPNEQPLTVLGSTVRSGWGGSTMVFNVPYLRNQASQQISPSLP
jgi:DnaJ-like protein